MTSFPKVFKNSFKIIYHDQTTIETLTLPAIWIFKKPNPILWLIFQNCGMFSSFVTSFSPNWDESCISCTKGDKKFKIKFS